MKKLPVSVQQNNWFDSQNVDDADLKLEQDYNNQIQSSIINNHFGTGVIADSLLQKVLFDSTLVSGLLDGKAIDVQNQPTDQNYGNQLEIELTQSLAAGKKAVKLLVIGLDFESNLQYDTFTIHTNEKQLSSKHYTRILKLFFNDFIGDQTQSFNLDGYLTIKEAIPFSLSRDCKMIAQDIEPNLFFRDFFVAGTGTLQSLLQSSLSSYNIDNLNIKTGYKELRSLVENDVSSQIGQKFIATTNNIQKITLLMSTINNTTPSDLAWTGDLIISLYQLQSSVSCPTDIVPSLAINFSPSNIPLAQLTINYNSLMDQGIILNTVPQPVDFIFSNTSIAGGSVIVPGNFYVITVKRAGSANKCQIQLAVGSNTTSNAMLTLFNGSIWVDIPESDLWFQVWTDSAKVSDGQAYEEGHGIQITKTIVDPNTGTTIDHSLNNIQFVRNDIYYAHVMATELDSTPVQDQRTGNPIYSRKQFVPSVELINSSNLAILEQTSDPLLVGSIADRNVKNYNSSTATISAKLHEFSIIDNKCVIKIIDDTTDGYRYDLDVINLVTEFANNTLINAKFIPNANNLSLYYRISKAELISMIYGDINGDGIVDTDDLALAQNFIGADLNVGSNTLATYQSLINPFVNDILLTYQIIDPNTLIVVASGTDLAITVNPLDASLATIVSASANFNSIANIGNYNFVVTGSPNLGNNGTFIITGLINNTSLAIRKAYYNANSITQIFRADINGDMKVDSADITLITNYINKVAPFPSTSSPGNKVGKSFQVIELTLEKYIDRADDYPSTVSNRATSIHINPDIFIDGYTVFAGHNFKTSPIPFQIIKQLNWQDYMVVSNSNPKLVPVAFEYETGFNINPSKLQGIVDQSTPILPSFDPGRNDFFIPNNLIINDGGEIINPDGYHYKVDMEVGIINFEIPVAIFYDGYTINLLTDFIGNYSGDGRTRLGYESMRFADNSFVGLDALSKNQLRFDVSLQSLSPQLSGTSITSLNGIIVDGKVGTHIDYSTGLLTLNFSNLYEDIINQTLNTKVQVIIHLKKGGFNNKPLFINSTITKNILGI